MLWGLYFSCFKAIFLPCFSRHKLFLHFSFEVVLVLFFFASNSNLSWLTQHRINSFSFPRNVRTILAPFIFYINITTLLYQICDLHQVFFSSFLPIDLIFKYFEVFNFLIKIICVIVCKYLNKSKCMIYYKMQASDTFCNTFDRDRGYKKNTPFL